MRRILLSVAAALLPVAFLHTGCSRESPLPQKPPDKAAAPNEPVSGLGKPTSYWIERLRGGQPQERRTAARALGEIGRRDPAVRPALIETLKDQDVDVRVAAALELTNIDPPRRDDMPTLGKALKHEDPCVRLQAVVALFRVSRSEPRDAVPAPISALKDKDPAVRAYVIYGLESLRSTDHLSNAAAIATLVEALRDEHGSVRVAAAVVLERMGPQAKGAVPALCEGLKDKDSVVRLWAAEVLRRMGPNAAAAVPALCDALNDSEPLVRCGAVAALGSIGPEAKDAARALSEVLEDMSPAIRQDTARALGSIGPEAKAAVPALMQAIKLVNFKERSFRDKDVEMLASMDFWKKMAPDKAKENRETVKRLKNDAKAVWEAYEIILTGVNLLEFRAVAAKALKKIDPEAAKTMVPELADALKDKDVVFRWAGASTLGYLGPDAKAAVPASIQATKDKYGAVSSAAAEALEKIDPEVAKSARENRE